MTTEELARQAGIHITASDRVYGVALSGLMKDDLERFAALVLAQALARYSGVKEYLTAAADGSMSSNNSENLAAELLAQIEAP